MAKKRCIACGTYFQIRTQVPHQTYCSSLACQRKRRQAWQSHKLQTDPDHLDNKSRAQQTWAGRNPDYWRQYREAHPEYVERAVSAKVSDWNAQLVWILVQKKFTEYPQYENRNPRAVVLSLSYAF